MLLLKICLSFCLLFSFQSQSSLFSLSPFSFLQKINDNKRKSCDEIINSKKKKKKRTPFECYICKGKFPSHDSLKDHFNNKHPGQYPYKCNECPHTSTTASNLYTHKKKRHPLEIDLSKHKCSFCAKSFPFLSELKDHQIIHTGKTPFKCNICFKLYYSSNGITSHINKLHTAKYSPCVFCSHVANNGYNLEQHYKNMHPLENTICEHCGKRIKWNNLLQEHKKSCSIKQNIEESSFPCFVCQQSCTNPFTLEQHHKDMHPLENTICEHCGKKFATKYSTNIHKTTCKSNKNNKKEDSFSHKGSPNHEANDPHRNDPPPYPTPFNPNFPPSPYTQTQEANDPHRNDPPPYPTLFNPSFPPSLYTQTQEKEERGNILEDLLDLENFLREKST